MSFNANNRRSNQQHNQPRLWPPVASSNPSNMPSSGAGGIPYNPNTTSGGNTNTANPPPPPGPPAVASTPVTTSGTNPNAASFRSRSGSYGQSVPQLHYTNPQTTGAGATGNATPYFNDRNHPQYSYAGGGRRSSNPHHPAPPGPHQHPSHHHTPPPPPHPHGQNYGAASYGQTHHVPPQYGYRGGVGMWQPHYNSTGTQGGGGSAAGSFGAGFTGAAAPPAPREKKILTITDKDGNVIDFSSKKKPSKDAPSTDEVAPSSVVAPAVVAPAPQVDANSVGARMKALAEQNIADGVSARKKREEEEKLKKEKEAKEKAEQEAKSKAERDAKEKAERDAKENAEREAKLMAERAAHEKAEREAREKTLKEAKLRAEREVKEKEEREAKEASACAQQAANPTTVPAPAPKPAAFRTSTPSLRPGSSSSLRPGGGGGLRPGGGKKASQPIPFSTPSSSVGASPGNTTSTFSSLSGKPRMVYTKIMLLEFCDLKICNICPPELPDMTIRNANQSRQSSGGPNSSHSNRTSNNSNSWARGNTPVGQAGNNANRPARSYDNNSTQWNRGQAPPPPKNVPKHHQGGNNRHNNNRRNGPNNYAPEFSGPVEPLQKNENRWVPVKSTNAIVTAQKKVKSILNKMTKEKFNKLAAQMCDMPIFSYEMLSTLIHNVYEKAIDEPAFGDMYADLCVRLAQKTNVEEFTHIMSSDETPDNGEFSVEGQSWRWSHDVSHDDEEVVGPLSSPQDCIDLVTNPEETMQPTKREDMELVLDSLKIIAGSFIKILKREVEVPDAEPTIEYYMVYFPTNSAEESGQQLSKIFATEAECVKDANKQNSFKRTLLNKCEDEFNKQDIYVDYKKEMKDYEKEKKSFSEADRREKESSFNFRRMKIKKQMLGNIKFIGELYKKHMIRENIMHYCIKSLLKLPVEDKKSEQKQVEEEMDAEDHEALCQLFTTIGKSIDKDKNRAMLQTYFNKIKKLSDDLSLDSRPRFMYKDVIELRANRWKLRREVEVAKTLDEIRKDAAREEMQSQDNSYRGGGGRGGGSSDRRDRGGRGGSGDYRSGSYGSSSSSRRIMSKPTESSDGFTQVVGKGGRTGRPFDEPTPSATKKTSSRSSAKSGSSSASASTSSKSSKSSKSAKSVPPPAVPETPTPQPQPAQPSQSSSSQAKPLTKDKLEHLIKNMRIEYHANKLEEDLLYSFEKVSGAPDVGSQIVRLNSDYYLESKADEKVTIESMFLKLYEHKKLTSTDFSPVGELVEFVGSFVIDFPDAYESLGKLVAVLIKADIVTRKWFCTQCEKLETSQDRKSVV